MYGSALGKCATKYLNGKIKAYSQVTPSATGITPERVAIAVDAKKSKRLVGRCAWSGTCTSTAIATEYHTASSLQNAMTASEERTSAEAEGYRIERSLMDCIPLPPF